MSAELADTWIDAAKVVGGLIAAFGIGIGGVIAGRKKAEPHGEAQVIAGSFTDRQAMADLTASVQHLETQVRRLADHHAQEERDEMAELKAEIRRMGKKPGEDRYLP